MIRKFGLSFAKSEQFSALSLELPDFISAIELPGEILDVKTLFTKAEMLRYQSKRLLMHSVFDQEFFDAVADANLPLRLSFDKQLRERCQKMLDLGVCTFDGGFDCLRSGSDKKYVDDFFKIFTPAFGFADENAVNILLRFRLPLSVGFDAPVAKFAELKSKSMCCHCGFSVDLHLHEPRLEQYDENYLTPLGFNTQVIRVVFHPEYGNNINESDLKKVFQLCPLKRFNDAVILFVPGETIVDDRIFLNLFELLKKEV